MKKIRFGFVGTGILVWMFLIFGIEPVQGDPIGQGIQSECGNSHSDNARGGTQPSERRHAGKSRRRATPKAERNRLDENKSSKKKPVGKRKKRRKSCGKKRRASPLPSEGSAKSSDKNNIAPKNREISSERIDDVPLLMAVLKKAGLQEIIDRHIPYHHKQRDLSWGWTAVIWLAYILSEGDHRKSFVRDYVKEMTCALKVLTGQPVSELDFTDDRLTKLLKYFSATDYWHDIEYDLGSKTIAIYDLRSKDVRVDATTVSGRHEVVKGGIFQFGNSKDDPNLPQIKLMSGSLDPLGMPLATDVVSGEKADDKLYIPIIDRISKIVDKSGLLITGDCKLSAFNIRLHIKGLENYYLTTLPMTGKTAEEMEGWIKEGIKRDKRNELEELKGADKKGNEILVSKGYEFERELSGVVDKKEMKWIERVIISKSPAYSEKMKKGFEKRLENAIVKINALTPQRGRGKRQITEESKLTDAAGKILKRHKVEGFINYEYERESEEITKYVGPGRGSKKKEKVTEERIRYQITNVSRNEVEIEEEKAKFGWKAFVTDVSKERLTFQGVIKHYRNEYRVERIFNRLKSRFEISPMYVKREDQIIGMTHFLTVAVKIYTLIEFVVRRSLRNDNEKLGDLHPENKRKKTDTPTAERLLRAFSNITLYIIESGEVIERSLSPLTSLQKNILERLGVGASAYEQLEITESTFSFSEW